ncbi:substrate-binding periplasmic protein [Roseibium sp. SCP14]|uniref:substrate-binding periplasmic protein n=1 Tax=Roseibium sp. SCP14 TaxID=3141375 RepID=UPI00333C67B5
MNLAEYGMRGTRLSDSRRYFLSVCLVLLLVTWGTAFALGKAHAQEMRLITSPWPPSNFLDENGTPTGISVEIVEALKKKLDIATPVEVIPWARGYLIAKSEPNVLLFTAGRTQERLDMGFQFIGPVVMWTHSLMAKKGSMRQLKDLDAVRTQNLTVAGVRGSWQMRLLQKAGIQTVEIESQETGVKMLLAGRVDLWVTSRLQASAILQDLKLPADSVSSVYTVRQSPSYLMLSSGTNPQLAASWRNAYEGLKQSDFFDKVAEKWSNELGIPLRFSPSDGFFADAPNKDTTGF